MSRPSPPRSIGNDASAPRRPCGDRSHPVARWLVALAAVAAVAPVAVSAEPGLGAAASRDGNATGRVTGLAGKPATAPASEPADDEATKPDATPETSTKPSGEAETPPHRPVRIVRSSGRGAPDRGQMRAWYRRYDAELAPVKRALGDLLAARKRFRPAELGPECRELARAVAGVDRERLFPVPDLAVGLHLQRLLAPLASTAEACAAGLPARTSHHLIATGNALRNLRLALLKYGLEP